MMEQYDGTCPWHPVDVFSKWHDFDCGLQRPNLKDARKRHTVGGIIISYP